MSRPALGTLVSGKYRIVRMIGDGGMGVVFEARHEILGSGVALKFLHTELAKRPGLSQRFLQEARVSATIQSPHVTRVTDVDTAQDGSPYLVMELLAGEALQALLDRSGRLTQEQAIDFALQILAGLEAAHATGVVHRDLKPDNVLITPSSGGPLLKLIDFGIAKLRASSEYNKGLTRAGTVMGTPEYMAPEQLVSAAATDHRADLYSLGVMLFEMLAGVRPADGDDAEVIVANVQAGRVKDLRELVPGVPEGLVKLIERATRPEREERFASASELRLELARFAGRLSHAGQLAATAEPLATLPTPPQAASLSFPAPGPGIPKTLPPEGPPLSVSQLGAARTSISENEPVMARAPVGPTAGDHQPHYSMPAAPAVPGTAGRSRTGTLVFAVLIALAGGAGAVGYAIYQQSDRTRDRPPPLPITGTGPAVTVAPLNTQSELAPQPPVTIPPRIGPRAAPTASATPSATGGPGPGPVLGPSGAVPPFQLPFPLPSGLVLPSAFPTAFPSGLQLPSGFPTSLPPGFLGQPPSPQPARGGAPGDPAK